MPLDQRNRGPAVLQNDFDGLIVERIGLAVTAALALVGQPVFVALAEKYGKTPAQVILRWHVQMGTSIIPGSKNPAHIADNANIFDFSLTEDEMAEIAKLDGTMTYYTATEEALAGYLAIRPDFDAQE